MLRIYLDSSDYSHMSDSRHAWAQPIRAFLKAQVEFGAIEIRFSSLHPLEGAHTSADAKPMAVERAKLMTELSGQKCLLWWHGLIEEESRRLALGESMKPTEYAYRDDGRWFPPSMNTNLAANLGASIETEIKEALMQTGAPRHQRRYALKQLVRSGRLTQAAIEMLRPGRAQLMEELRKKYPWPRRFFDDDLLFQYMTGNIAANVLVEALEDGLKDVVSFIGWAYDQYDPEQKLTRWLRSGDWIGAVAKIRSDIQGVVELGRTIGKTEKDINMQLRRNRSWMPNARARILRGTLEDIPLAYRLNCITSELWEQRVVNSALGSIPSLDAALEIAAAYFLQNAMAGSKRELLTSDYGDMLHMGYLPYVDLFRCDGYAADLARRVASKYGTEVVGKLTELPDAIAQRLDAGARPGAEAKAPKHERPPTP